MASLRINHDIEQFVLELLRTGAWLVDVASELIDALPPDAYPGEDPGQVVVDMLNGTVASVLESADPCEVRRATELIEMARERTLEHLQLALAMSRRMRAADGGLGPAYG